MTLVLAAEPPALHAQADPVQTHTDHILTAFPGTPEGEGLLPTALAEAEIVRQHIAIAADDLTYLEGMQTHAAHVLHALDPQQAVGGGPGRGFGLKPAAEAIAGHIELAASADGASRALQTHATHVAASSRTVSRRADQLIDMAKRIATAADYTTAATLVEQMQLLSQQLAIGHDADGNGEVGWQEGEGGLNQITQHMGYIMRAGDME